MMKRMTLLAKRDGLATSDFRAYWAGPHAQLALGMDGIVKYTHNRVEKVLWASNGDPAFSVDGVVELSFSDSEVMRQAQASAVGTKFIPADEPQFLKGWTLCVVEEQGDEPQEQHAKVLIPFHAQPEARNQMWVELQGLEKTFGIRSVLNWTVTTARRERLWAEPVPPSGFVAVWFADVATAHEAFEPESRLRPILEKYTTNAVAYLIDRLCIR